MRDDRYRPGRDDVLQRLQQRERVLARQLAATGLTDLVGLRVLELGCGSGGELASLLRFGSSCRQLHGLDLSASRLIRAAERLPAIHWVRGDGMALPYRDGSFQLVCQFTVFSSVLNPDCRQKLATEIQRVLTPGGWLLWYDFRVNNPRNPDVRGVTHRELRRLFPGWAGSVRRLTLLPPLARRLPPSLAWLGIPLGALPFLQTHLQALLRKPATQSRTV